MDAFAAVIVVLVIFAVVFMLCREIFCWYWKFNTMVEQGKRQNELLEDVCAILRRIADATERQTSKQEP